MLLAWPGIASCSRCQHLASALVPWKTPPWRAPGPLNPLCPPCPPNPQASPQCWVFVCWPTQEIDRLTAGVSTCLHASLVRLLPLHQTFAFSLRRGFYVKQVFSRASFYCRRLVLVGLLFLSSLCSHVCFLFSFGFCRVGFWDISIVHRPAPSPVVFAAVARSFGLDFDYFASHFCILF